MIHYSHEVKGRCQPIWSMKANRGGLFTSADLSQEPVYQMRLVHISMAHLLIERNWVLIQDEDRRRRGGNSIILAVAPPGSRRICASVVVSCQMEKRYRLEPYHGQPNKRTGELSQHGPPKKKCTGPEIYPKVSDGRLSTKQDRRLQPMIGRLRTRTW